MQYSKPYLTLSQQINLLKSRGMDIPTDEKAEEYLRRIGYYRLSAYWYPFRRLVTPKSGPNYLSDDFNNHTVFQNTTDLYAFDKGLRLITLDAIERLEVSLRTELALALGSIGPQAHRNPSNFRADFNVIAPDKNKSEYSKWLDKLDFKEKKSKEDFAKHFRSKHPNQPMPIWIAVELLDFGPLSIIVAELLQAQQNQISKSYGNLNFRLIKSWTRTISNIRNICAHHARLWNRVFTNQPALPRNIDNLPNLTHLNHIANTNKKLYASLAIMRQMLKFINPRTKWAERLISHIETFPTNAPNISIADAGFPEDWECLPLWYD